MFGIIVLFIYFCGCINAYHHIVFYYHHTILILSSNMKKILLLLAVVFTALQMSAADVSASQAQAAANAFLRKQVAAGRLKASAASDLRLVKSEASVAKPAAVDYYIFNSAKSYVVVAGDDQAPQILMYGEEGALDLNNIPPAMQWLLNKFKYQIDGLKAGTLVPLKATKFATTPVAPLVTATWDQSAPYNNQCPGSSWSRALTGCPATSLSMCYYKWKWPETFPACAAISGTGGSSASALSERAADWANIIDHYGTYYDDNGSSHSASYTTDQANAVAWLMRYAGQSIPDYYYSSSASGANDPEIYQGVLNMGYTDAQYLLLTEFNGSSNGSQKYTDAQWNEWMLNELHNGRPIEYLAYDSRNSDHGGHAFNVFGVDSSGKYYVNWGWSGSSNGYCTLHNFTTANGSTSGSTGSYIFNWGEAMIIGIEPPAGALNNPRITVNPTTLTMNATVGTPETATFTVTGANLTSNVALSISGDNAFSLSTTSISASQAENGVTVTVTYNPTKAGNQEATVTLTSTDAETVTVKLNGTADAAPLETYPPVMLDASNITSTSFTASWTDETPSENVASYTLYVQDESHPIQPEVALLDTTDWTANNNIPSGWTQSKLKYWSTTSACYLSSGGYVQSKTYDLTGYDKMTVMIYAQPDGSPYTMTIETSVDSETITMQSGATFAWYTFVVDCATSDYVKLTTGGMHDLRYMKVYAGDLTNTQRKESETGDATYRVITGITSKSYTVTGLTEGGTFNFYVVANYINDAIGTSNTKQVTLLENTNPVLTVNPATVDMAAVVGESVTATFNVSGANLTGDVTLTLNDENGVYSIEPTTISAADVMSGKDVTVTYTPAVYGSNNATITLSSAGAEDVTVTLNGTASLFKEAPVMQPANEVFINLTKFRADWTDATPDENVDSYTLEVNIKPDAPAYTELQNVDFSSLTAQVNSSNQYTNQVNYASNYLPAGWTATSGLFIDDGAIISGQLTQNNSSYVFSVATSTYDLTGYDKVTVVFKASTFNSNYGTSVTVNVATSAGSQDVTVNTEDFNTYTVVLDCAESDNVTFTGVSGLYCMSGVTIYAGDINAANALLLVQETGDENSRLITGITDKFYTVENLTAEGTFLYRVKAVYADGTESDWSNIEEVTLFANEHPFQMGDVNHDGFVNVSDVTALIAHILGNNDTACEVCGNINGDQYVNVSDVTALIANILNNGQASIQAHKRMVCFP